MGLLAWVMMGIAIWHFTVFLPDRFWGGIVGAFVGAVFGAVLISMAFHGFTIPGRTETDVMTAIEAIPGTLIGLGVVWLFGVRQENKKGLIHTDAFGRTTAS